MKFTKKKVRNILIGTTFVIGLTILLVRKSGNKKSRVESAAEILGVGRVENRRMKTYFNFKTRYTGNLQADMTNFTKEAEGGQVKAKTDHASTYSKVSAKEPVHTNIGITRAVFDKYASILHYDNSYSNFLRMPMDIWYKIFSEVYVKPFTKISSIPVINDMIAGWGWGSGVRTALNSLKKFLLYNGQASLDELTKAIGKEKVFEKLVLWRMKFFKNISPKFNPRTAKASAGVYTDGWLNREANFYNIFIKYLG